MKVRTFLFLTFILYNSYILISNSRSFRLFQSFKDQVTTHIKSKFNKLSYSFKCSYNPSDGQFKTFILKCSLHLGNIILCIAECIMNQYVHIALLLCIAVYIMYSDVYCIYLCNMYYSVQRVGVNMIHNISNKDRNKEFIKRAGGGILRGRVGGRGVVRGKT